MGLFFPDNDNRQQRVCDLTKHCYRIRTMMHDSDKQWKIRDSHAYSYLEQVAKAAYLPSPQEYLDEADAIIPEDVRKNWDENGYTDGIAAFDTNDPISDAIANSAVRDRMRGLINEWAARRFVLRQAQMGLDECFKHVNDMSRLVLMERADGPIPEAMKAANIRHRVADSATQYKASFNDTKDEDVKKSLDDLDASSKSWTNEDPDLNGIKKWLVDNPQH